MRPSSIGGFRLPWESAPLPSPALSSFQSQRVSGPSGLPCCPAIASSGWFVKVQASGPNHLLPLLGIAATPAAAAL